jgi:prephenate dehydratase
MNRTIRGSIAFQGEHGAFSEEAARRYFGPAVRTHPCRSFRDVFAAVDRNTCAAGIVPIENSLFGSVHENYDLLDRYDLRIAGELKMRIVHALLVNPGVRLRQVKTVYSHPQALGQCEKFLGTLKGRNLVAVYDTAGAAKTISAERRTDAAAVAGIAAAERYRLTPLKVGIENDHRNFTRFLILARSAAATVRGAKTSVLFSLKNVPGALFTALGAFALRGINLFKIESRPIAGRPWEYRFYLDCDGSASEPRCREAIDHLRDISTHLKILGSYPKGRTVGGGSR